MCAESYRKSRDRLMGSEPESPRCTHSHPTPPTVAIPRTESSLSLSPEILLPSNSLLSALPLHIPVHSHRVLARMNLEDIIRYQEYAPKGGSNPRLPKSSGSQIAQPDDFKKESEEQKGSSCEGGARKYSSWLTDPKNGGKNIGPRLVGQNNGST